jgi:hypothetical protein
MGHGLVVPAVFWARVGGHLWWRRWGNPDTTADVWVRGAAVRNEFTIRPREGSRPGRWSVVGVGEVPAGVQRLRGAGVAQST